MPAGVRRWSWRSERLRAECVQTSMDLRYWQKVLNDAEREVDAATTRTALDAAKKLRRPKAELKRLQAMASA
jgi:hypothetical protein